MFSDMKRSSGVCCFLNIFMTNQPQRILFALAIGYSLLSLLYFYSPFWMPEDIGRSLNIGKIWRQLLVISFELIPIGLAITIAWNLPQRLKSTLWIRYFLYTGLFLFLIHNMLWGLAFAFVKFE